MEAEASYEGIAGIVAGKIKETYYRPAVIVTPTGEGEVKGTGRSIEGVNLYELLKTQEDLFEKFGGHSGACGFSMKRENLPALRAGLERQMKELRERDPQIFRKKYDIDLKVSPDDLTVDLADQLEMLAPFGSKNPKPLMRCKDVMIDGVRYMGDELQHVRFYASGDGGARVQCVLFGRAQDYDFEEIALKPADIIGTLECQVWQGSKRLQFLVNEIQIDEEERQ